MHPDLADALPTLPGGFRWRVRRATLPRSYHLDLMQKVEILGLAWWNRKIDHEYVFLHIGSESDLVKFNREAREIMRRSKNLLAGNPDYTGEY